VNIVCNEANQKCGGPHGTVAKATVPEALLPRVRTLGDTLSALGASPGLIYQKKQTKNEKYKRNTEHSMSQVTKLLMKMLIIFTITWEILHDRFDGIER
jgi:hypothetical protein